MAADPPSALLVFASAAFVAAVALACASLWRLFAKAGVAPWKSVVPLVNAAALCELAGKPAWWVCLLLVPLVNVAVAFAVAKGLARAFGRSTAFGMGLVVAGLVFLPILAFGGNGYGPRAPAAPARALAR